MRRVVLYGLIVIAVVVLLTACGDNQLNRRAAEGRDWIEVQRTVSGESLATCLARNGFVYDEAYEGVQGTTNLMYDKGPKEALTLNVDRNEGIVAPWAQRDNAVLAKYHCLISDVSDVGPAASDNSSR